VTCPCALALAVPAVQVIATSRLFKSGILLKSGTALERLAQVDTVVFDKTGTLTEPTPALVADGFSTEALRAAAGLAAHSRHPLARSLLAAAGPVVAAEHVTEVPGQGLAAHDARLGSRSFCGIADGAPADGPELWFTRTDHAPIRFAFAEHPRPGTAETIANLRNLGLSVKLISGDNAHAVRTIANAIGIGDWRAGCSPVDKTAMIEALAQQGRRVFMVGDGLNDSPCLAAAYVSASPSTAADISQTVADVVFQGANLAPIVTTMRAARHARAVMRSNLALAIGYNLVMVPLAVAGWVTPWLAAAAMSTSSLLVMANSFQVRRA